MSKKYRYFLKRDLDTGFDRTICKDFLFIGLNPSTADAENDDPTIRRLIGMRIQLVENKNRSV